MLQTFATEMCTDIECVVVYIVLCIYIVAQKAKASLLIRAIICIGMCVVWRANFVRVFLT